MTLRAARDEDAALLRGWRNDEDTIRVSATSRAVSETEHARWLAATLADPNRRLWIAEEKGVPVGQVRIDFDGDVGVFSIAVAPAERGRGLGQAMLRAAVADAKRDRRIATLTAIVREDNLASIHAFEAVGFNRASVSADGFVALDLQLV